MAAEYVRLAHASDREEPGLAGGIAAARQALSPIAEHEGRRAFLLAQLEALERRARFLAGGRMSIRDEARALGLSVPEYDGQRAAQLRAELDASLPGSDTLIAKLSAYKRAGAISRSQLDAVVHTSIAACKERTPVPANLHDGGTQIRYVIDRPWPAFTTSAGKGVSVVEIRRDALWTEDDLASVLCHETYPGHHLQNLVWGELHRVELSVTPMFTPHGVMAERSAVAATALVVPRGSRPAPARVLDDLAPLALAVAIATVDGAITRTDAVRQLREELLMPDAEAFIAFVQRYRSMAVAYVTPLPEVRDWPSYFVLLRSPQRWAPGAAQ